MPCSKSQCSKSSTGKGVHKQASVSQAKKEATPPQINQKLIAAAERASLAGFLSVVAQYLQQMNLVNLSTSVHRLAKFLNKDPEAQLAVVQSKVFVDLKRAIYNRLTDSRGPESLHQSLSNIAWSLARLHVTDLDLLGRMASLSTSQLAGFKPFELVSLLSAFAKLGLAERLPDAAARLFGAAGAHLADKLEGFSFRCLATVAYSYAAARQPDPALFSCLALQMRRAIHTADCQDIGNTVWAFATVGHCDPKLLAALAKAALPLLPGFKPQEISNMLWGLATLGFGHKEAFVWSIYFASQMQLSTQHLTNIVWASAETLPKQTAIDTAIIALAPECTRAMRFFKPEEVASIVQSLAKVLLQRQDEAPEVAANKQDSIRAVVHGHILALLESLAKWVAHNCGSMPSVSFATTVSSLVLLGKLTELRLDLVVEHAVLERDGTLPPAVEVLLFQAFLSEPFFARAPVAMLAASLAESVDFLHGGDFKALQHLYLTMPGAPLSCPEPSHRHLQSWCTSLASGLSSDEDGGLSETPSVTGSDVGTSDGGAPRLDDAQFGSQYRIPTAESLAFPDWQPAPCAAVGTEHGQIAGFIQSNSDLDPREVTPRN